MCRALQTEHGLPWIYVDRIAAVDPATLGVLGSALSDDTVAALLCVRTTESSVPAGLRGLPRAAKVELPSLDPNEALLVATGILGQDTHTEIATQLVITGGTTVLGIMEAARTMVATGDIVHDGSRFVWRDETADRRQHLGPRALLEERFATLDTSSMRFLEIACTALPASSVQVVDAAVALDGVPNGTRRRALEALVNDGLLTPEGKPDSELLRRAVVQRMPPGAPNRGLPIRRARPSHRRTTGRPFDGGHGRRIPVRRRGPRSRGARDSRGRLSRCRQWVHQHRGAIGRRSGSIST